MKPEQIWLLQKLQDQCRCCDRCDLALQRSQVVFGRGNPKAKLLLIGEAPGQKEDQCGEPFMGKAGQLLEKLLSEAGLCSKNDLYICNVIKCRPPNNRKPDAAEIKQCLPWLEEQIGLINPRLVLLAGATAVEAILGVKAKLGLQRGYWHHQQERSYRVIYHPSYLLRFGAMAPESPRTLTLQDLREVAEQLRKSTEMCHGLPCTSTHSP
jgi:DNA polymerase